MWRAFGLILLILVLVAVLAFLVDRNAFLRTMDGADKIEAVETSGPPPASGNEAEPVVRKKRP